MVGEDRRVLRHAVELAEIDLPDVERHRVLLEENLRFTLPMLHAPLTSNRTTGFGPMGFLAQEDQTCDCGSHDYQTQGISLFTRCSYSEKSHGNVDRRTFSSCPIFFRRIYTPNKKTNVLTSPRTRTIPTTATRSPR